MSLEGREKDLACQTKKVASIDKKKILLQNILLFGIIIIIILEVSCSKGNTVQQVTYPTHCSHGLLSPPLPLSSPAEVVSWPDGPGTPPASADSDHCHTEGWASSTCWGSSHSWHCSQRTHSLYQNQGGTYGEGEGGREGKRERERGREREREREYKQMVLHNVNL